MLILGQGRGFMFHLPLHIGIWSDLSLHRSRACCHKHCASMCQLICRVQKTLLPCCHPSPLSLTLFLFLLLQRPLILGKGSVLETSYLGLHILHLVFQSLPLDFCRSLHSLPSTENRGISDEGREMRESINTMINDQESVYTIVPCLIGGTLVAGSPLR